MGCVEGVVGRVDFQKVKSTMVDTRMMRSCGWDTGVASWACIRWIQCHGHGESRTWTGRYVPSVEDDGFHYPEFRLSLHELLLWIEILMY